MQQILSDLLRPVMVRDSMATFYLDAAFISACRGGSAVRAAAYRHAVRMVSHAFTETTSFTHKAQAMVHAEIALPEDAPDWADNAFGHAAFADALRLVRADVQAQGSDMSEAAMQRAAMARVSEQLWNAVEHGEIRLNRIPTRAQYARSLTVALPRELDQAAQIALMQGYVRVSFSDRGMVADWVIHDKSDGNPHAHIMLTTRDLGSADWGRKRCDWNARDVLSGLRSDWAQHANLALERGGFNERIDHRSNHARGIYLEPDSYNPHVASHARRQGEIAREANRCSDVADANAFYLQQHPAHILVVVQAQRAVFTRGDIVAAFEDRLMLTETELAGLVGEAMGSGAAVRLVQNSPDGQAQYVTTARASEMQRLEILARAMAIAGPVAGSGPTAPGIGLLAGSGLTPDQRVAAEAMLSPASLTLVKGYAGTGKTFTLGEVARVWQARGYEVLGGAASGKATQELGGIKGMRTASLAAWDARWSRGEALERDRFVFIMDEAGMVGAGQWVRIAGVVEARGGQADCGRGSRAAATGLGPAGLGGGGTRCKPGNGRSAGRGAQLGAAATQHGGPDGNRSAGAGRRGNRAGHTALHRQGGVAAGQRRAERSGERPGGGLLQNRHRQGARWGGLRADCAGLYQPRGLGAERRNPGAGAGARRDRSGRYSRLRHDHADRQNDPDPRADCGAAGARTGRPGDADAPAPRP